MTDWASFPSRSIGAGTPLWRIHPNQLHPAWFDTDGLWRFDPIASYRDRFGVCYLGVEPLASYGEVFGRIRALLQSEIDRRSLSQLTVSGTLNVADVTDRTVLGDFGITASHSVGTDYGPAQELAVNLFDAGFDGI